MSDAPRFGVRFELTLREHEDDRAIYDATVALEAGTVGARVEVTTDGARLIEADRALDAAHGDTLLAIARSIGRRAEGASWPRRIHRWKQPGVR